MAQSRRITELKCLHLLALALSPSLAWAQLSIPWSGYAHDPQHTGTSATAAQALNSIHWQTPIDTSGAAGGNGSLFVHYGSPVVTAANTVIVPVTTSNGYQLEAFNGATGAQIYTLSSCIASGCYTAPPLSWTPPYGPALSLGTRLYYPGPGGTIFYRTNPDSATGAIVQVAFYGMNGATGYSNHQAAFNNTIQISTPLTADHAGNIFFGFTVTGSNPAGLATGGGIARVSIAGTGTSVTAVSLTGDSTANYIAFNCAPALSVTQATVYVATTSGGYAELGTGYLTSLSATTLAPIAHVQLFDPRPGYGLATVASVSSAAPMVAADGDVYYGVLEANCCTSHNDRGWMLHFNSALTQTKTPGSFGWDNTASVVPSTSVPSYTGTSSYLILTKFNNYANAGGNGVNKIAILDPNATMQDEYSSVAVTVMQEVITVTGVPPNPGLAGVREWCINTAAIDPYTKAAIINSEDGTVYRWDFSSNTLLQRVSLTSGRSEAYTPTVIGPDGTAYAINDAILFAVGN